MCAVVVELTSVEAYRVLRLALKSWKRNRHLKGHYAGNTLDNHLLGKLGEFAVEKWLRSEGLDPDAAYGDLAREGEADLVVNEVGVEVKSWRPDTWSTGGRCIRPKQMKGIQAKSGVIVWGIVDDDADPFRVTLPGWSRPSELAEAEVRITEVGKWKFKNHQVEVAQLHDVQELLDELRGGSPRAATAVA